MHQRWEGAREAGGVCGRRGDHPAPRSPTAWPTPVPEPPSPIGTGGSAASGYRLVGPRGAGRCSGRSIAAAACPSGCVVGRVSEKQSEPASGSPGGGGQGSGQQTVWNRDSRAPRSSGADAATRAALSSVTLAGPHTRAPNRTSMTLAHDLGMALQRGRLSTLHVPGSWETGPPCGGPTRHRHVPRSVV